jgi:hypothetical protein
MRGRVVPARAFISILREHHSSFRERTAARVKVFRVDVPSCVDQTCFNIFEAVRFLADVLDSIDPNMPSLAKADGLLAANISPHVSAFRFRVKFILSKNLTISVDT